jgi:hypothetical protein
VIRYWIAVLAGVAVLAVPVVASADVGVGVGTGKIEIQEKIKTGGIYTLPSITVFNTGTERSAYKMSVTFNQTQPQLKPKAEWFSFSPVSFTLEPNKSQVVIPTQHAPLRAQPGDYFAYLEARPDETVQQGTATIGVAAATKLSFTMEQSNIIIAFLYRLLSLYRQFEPWSQIVSVAVILVIALGLLNRYLIRLGPALKAAWRAGRPSKKKHKEE